MSGSHVQTERTAILGASGTGKSTLLWARCLTLAFAGQAVWLFDPHGNHRAHAAGIVQVQPVRGAALDASGPYFDQVQQLARAAMFHGGVTVVLEEANLAVRTGHQAPHAVTSILHEGRHLPHPTHPRCGVGAILVSRRPVEIPPAWLSQCAHVYVFRLTNARDLERVRAEGFPSDDVRALRVGEFFHLDANSGRPPHKHAHAFSACCTE